MAPIDQRGKLDEETFSYLATKDSRVRLSFRGKLVKTLSGGAAQKFLTQVDSLDGKDAQLVMARATGHFKHGNERRSDESH